MFDALRTSDTLLYSSLLGLFENLAGITMGPATGRYIDHTNRLSGIPLPSSPLLLLVLIEVALHCIMH